MPPFTSRPRRRPAHDAGGRPLARDARAVSDVLGSTLLVGITVMVMGGLAVMLMQLPGPMEAVNAELTTDVAPGADLAWGTGDEEVIITHRGGEALLSRETTVRVTIGAQAFSYRGNDLGSGFSDGRLGISETWTGTFTLAKDDVVKVDVTFTEGRGGSTLLSTSSIIAGVKRTVTTVCDGDVTGPRVAVWRKTPEDLYATHVGAVIVNVTLTDDCIGVDESMAPHLWYRSNATGTEAFVDAGAMTRTEKDTWEGEVPDLGWSLRTGEVLEWYVTGMTDRKGNTGNSSVQSDAVELAPATYTYTDAYVASAGSIIDFQHARSASDSGLEADVREGLVSTIVVQDTYATTSATVAGLPTNVANARGTPDNVYASLNAWGDEIKAGGFGTQSDLITKVEIAYEGHYTGTHSDDKVELSYDVGGSGGATKQQFNPSASDTTVYLDVTADRTWSWTDIGNLNVHAAWRRSTAADAMTVNVDALWVRVSTERNTYTMTIDLNFTDVPAATTHTLQLQHRVESDTFLVQVWDGVTWNTRGTNLTSTSSTLWEVDLTVAEYNLGDPRVRFLDETPSGSVRGHIWLDHARVKSV